MFNFLLKASAILTYMLVGSHLFFTEWQEPRFIFGGLMNIPEAVGLLFILSACFMLVFFSTRKGA